MLADLRDALRQLRKAPGFTTTAVVTLALGIGATTSIFTLVHQVMLKVAAGNEPGRTLAHRRQNPLLQLGRVHPGG
jgi:putative ABC transport system permease protein